MARKVKIIGVPMDLGAGRRGVDMGPSAIRIAGLNGAIARLGYEVADAGNVHVHPPEAIERTNPRAHFLPEIAAAAEELATMVEAGLTDGAIPVILGGDHSIAIGSVAGLAAYHRKRKEKIGIIWLDAHTDINTPDTTPSGNIHGMPLAVLLGQGARELTHIGGFAPKLLPEHSVVVGARSVDPGERDIIKALGVRVFTMTELDERGMADVIEEAIEIA
ncbi:MAG TPA: arginase, partial [Blastocatellia bacterium]|nr:arginase [Blastocatellia bacterium]